jgi:hypothetical protein
MIVAVCSDKGAPGGTTLAVALGMVWPGPRAVVEADVAGGDLALRVRSESGDFLTSTPSLASLSTAARMATADPAAHAQLTSLQVPVVAGPPSARRFRAVRSTWPVVASSLAAWSGTAIADLGRLDAGLPSVPVAQAATVALLVTRYDVEGLARLRDRVDEQTVLPAPTDDGRTRVGVVVVAPSRQAGEAIAETQKVLDSVGSPVPVAGSVAWDPRSASALWAGVVTRRLAGGELIRSTRTLAESILTRWPEVAAAAVAGSSSDNAADSVPPTPAGGRRPLFGGRPRQRPVGGRAGDTVVNEGPVTVSREVSS